MYGNFLTLLTIVVSADYKVFPVQRTRSRYGSDIKVTGSAQVRPIRTQSIKNSVAIINC